MMASGARGNRHQVKQHVAMRGLFATPDGRVMEAPCTTNFVRGMSPLEYLASTMGARKGLADTCLKTANAGFLFKRIMSAVHDVMITEQDCGTETGVVRSPMRHGDRQIVPLELRLQGRTAAEDIALEGADGIRVEFGQLISEEAAAAIAASGATSVTVRSPLTCRSTSGICSRCYGADLSTWQPATIGLAVGVLAAHSLGEPLTQLTLRTFYVGALSGSTRGGRAKENPTILGGMPRLDELLEAGAGPSGSASEEGPVLEEMLQWDGALATAEYLLTEMMAVYRQQGVHIDDRHFEVILRQMLGQKGAVLGVSEAARRQSDFVGVATTYGGVPELARAAARGDRTRLNQIRSCTVFGKVIPSAAPEA